MSGRYVGPEKQAKLNQRMQELGILESELDEQFVQGSGRGGQKLNKTSSCVQLSHAASGVVIKCQKTRSRELNRYYARQLLCDKIDEKISGEASAKQQEYEKIRRQKRRRSRKQKARMLESKRQRSELKATRRSVNPGEDS